MDSRKLGIAIIEFGKTEVAQMPGQLQVIYIFDDFCPQPVANSFCVKESVAAERQPS
ncbi:MAG: hypothetical protein ACRD3S_12250 [Terracidiphilus sp.]